MYLFNRAIITSEGSVMIQPLTKRTIAEDIIDQLMNMIRSGELKPNTRLPSERELANQFGVSRTSS